MAALGLLAALEGHVAEGGEDGPETASGPRAPAPIAWQEGAPAWAAEPVAPATQAPTTQAQQPRRPRGVQGPAREVVAPGWVRREDGTWVEVDAARPAPALADAAAVTPAPAPVGRPAAAAPRPARPRVPGGLVPTSLARDPGAGRAVGVAAPDDEPLPAADDVLPPADDVLPPADAVLPRDAAAPPGEPWDAADRPAAPQGAPGAPADEGGIEDYSDMPAWERPIVQRIDLVGARLYTVDSIETRMRTKVGRRLDPVALEADLAELRRFFAEIQVVRELVPGGIVLRLLVSENPLIERLVVRGNAEMDLDEIRPLLRTREGYPLSPIHLAADRDDIVAAYRLRGFHFADVPEPRISTLPSGGKRVDVTIVEGPKVEVAKVHFRGRRHLERDALLEAMQLQEPSFLEALVNAIVYREDLLREDLVAIQEVYRDAGFLDAEAALEDLRFSDDKSKVEITIAVDEGAPYVVGTIEVEFDRVEPGGVGAPLAADLAYFTPERIRDLLGLASGERWNGATAREGTKKIKEAYLERSFHDARVVGPDRRGRLEPGIVDLRVKIIEGPKYRLARIDFVGNEFTRDNILRREVETAPGGYVDGNELERGTSRLRRTGYFQRSDLRLDDAIGPDGEPVPGWKTATYQIVEGSTGQANFGFQIDPTGSQGLGAFISLRKRNFDITRWPTSWEDLTSGRAFTGAGQTFEILISPSTEETAFSVKFVEPRVFGSKLGLSLAAFRRISFREAHDVDTLGYAVGLSYPLLQQREGRNALFADVGWQHKWVDISEIGPSAVPGVFLFDGENEMRSLSTGLRWVTVDDLRDPRFEATTQAGFEWSGGGLGGDIDMTRFTSTHTQVHTLHVDADGGKHRFTLTGAFGIAEAFGDTPEVPPYERWTLGGRDLRGFEYRGVGPRVNGNPTGGEAYWRVTGEYEFPIAAQQLSGVVFGDFGAVEPTLRDLDLDDTRIGVGIGLRIKLPMLGERPLAVDFGWALRSQDQDREQLISFSFGRTF